MRNQQEWSANRGYIQHIQVLKRINARKIPSHPKPIAKHRNSEPFSDVSQNKASDSKLERNGQNTTLRQKQILWENYFLGKRIIETHPVICKKKLDDDFRQHRRILGCLTSSSSRKQKGNQFRIKKLQEYKESIEHAQDTSQAINRNLIKITINSVAFYRQKPSLDNLQLVFSYINKHDKRHVQRSERIPAEQFIQKPFCFVISKRLIANKNALTLQIENIKGLNEFSIGYFTFPSCEPLHGFACQLYHCGKPIGQIQLSTAYPKTNSHLKTAATEN